MKLYYFEFPGRGEAARLMLALSGESWEDVRIPFKKWPEMKFKMPFHQVPVLELDNGRMIAQMAAIDRYCASLAGLMPSDPLELAAADMVHGFLEDLWAPLGPLLPAAGPLTDEERSQRWQERVEKPFNQRLALLDKHLAQREGRYVAGDQLTYGDITLFAALSQIQCGWVKGVPCDILSAYPAVKELRHLVASLPKVAAYYSNHESEMLRQGFSPDSPENGTKAEE